MPTFALNFSRPGNQIVAQYYNLIRLGFEGYRRVQQASRDVAMELAERIAAMGRFRMITDGSNLPVIAFSLADDDGNYSVFDVSKLLREGGWLVPAYTFPENREDLAVLRVVVRNGFSQDLADFLIDDLKRALQYLDKLETRLPPVVGEPFHH
jgi:glutamate decarboxylase